MIKEIMDELVSLDHIDVMLEAEDWKDAIRLSGEILLNSGDITKAYIDEMINAVEELGPYMVLTKGFALAHCAPSPSVIRSSISLINLKEPVNFNSHNDPVSVVMCLACTDKESHISKIQKIAYRLMKENMIEELSNCHNKEELYAIINQEKEEE